MNARTIASTVTATLLVLSSTSAAIAQSGQYTGPSQAAAPGHYSGPSSVPLLTVKQLLDSGRDDQPARLQGRIVSHDGGERYTFEDATGRITVEIDPRRFPANQSVSAEQRVELVGEFDKGLRKREFEVDRMTLLP